MLKIALMGDVMLGRYVNELLPGMLPGEPWGDTLPLLHAADLRILNLECAITRYGKPWTRTPKTFHFRADPSVAEVLQAAKINACSLANNHTLDFEEQGLIDTLENLDSAGIAYAGAGRTGEEAARTLFLAAQDMKIALIAYTDNEPQFAADVTHAGTHFLPVSVDKETLSEVGETIASARQQGAEIVIFSNHWGPNMVQRPRVEFREFARAVISLGADIYYGHSAHVFQGVEIFQGKPILYDTGDFIDDYAVDPFMRNDWSFLFQVVMDGRQLKRIDMYPVKLSVARVELARGEQSESIMRRMEHLCDEMGTSLRRRDQHLVYEPA